jgi:hypothetical protein
MGAKAGPKGKSGEYEVRDLLTAWGCEVGVVLDLSRNLLQVREGGADIDGVTGLEIEVKRVEANGINQWWAQVCRAADKSGKTPMLAHRRNRQPWRFRVRTTVALHDEYSNRWKLFPVVADLELIEAKQWFQRYIEVFH